MSAATDNTNLAELRRTMTLWHNRVTALGFDGVSDLIALAEAGCDEMKKAWPIGERIALKLMMIKQIGEGSTTANSLPHVARIADEALQLINIHQREAPRWRLLRRGEPLHLSDAGLQDAWVPWLTMVGWEVGMTYEPGALVPIRRKEA